MMHNTMTDPHLYEYEPSDNGPRCKTCHGHVHDEIHITHSPACKDFRANSRYNPGQTKGCPACEIKIATIIATGCTHSPFAAYCGHAMSGGSCGKCGRQPDTD